MSDLSAGGGESGATPATAADPSAPAPAAEPAAPAAPLTASERAAAAAAAQAAPTEPPAAPEVDPAAPDAEAPEPAATADPFLEAFSGYDEATRNSWATLAKLMADDPEAGAKEFQRIASLILEGDDEPAAAEPEPTEEIPKTKEELERYLAERDAKKAKEREEEEAVEQVFKDAETLTGYDRNSRQMRDFLVRAHEGHGGDLDAAWKEVQAERQAIIDAYVAEQAARNDGFAPQPGATGEAPADPSGKKPSTWAESRASLMQRLSASR